MDKLVHTYSIHINMTPDNIFFYIISREIPKTYNLR